MNAHSAVIVLLVVAALAGVLTRQLRTGPVKLRLLVVVPLAMAYAGLRGLDLGALSHPIDAVLVAAGGIASAGLGVWRGTTVRLWREADGTWWRKGSVSTLLLWGAVLLVRVVEVVIDHAVGHPQAAGPGVVLCSLALSFAGESAVILWRMQASTAPVAVTAS